jgi:hypothetical protein
VAATPSQIVLAWTVATGSGTAIEARRYGVNGQPIPLGGPVVLVAPELGVDLKQPHLALTDDGLGALLVWVRGEGQVMAQRFDSSLVPLGTAVAVESGNGTSPRVVSVSNGTALGAIFYERHTLEGVRVALKACERQRRAARMALCSRRRGRRRGRRASRAQVFHLDHFLGSVHDAPPLLVLPDFASNATNSPGGGASSATDQPAGAPPLLFQQRVAASWGVG